IETLTGFPETLDGRVKTLHPRVHAGLLADLRLDAHARQLDELGIAPFELLVSNLYPFRETVASGASDDECVEQIDIGGPAMVRYGENPHQSAALFVPPALAGGGLAQAVQLGGKEMSYNNYVDADAAWRSANDFAQPCVAIIKHANPCGIAVGADVAEAHRKAHECDPVSAYGGVIGANRPVTTALAEQLAGVLTEVICAPDFDEGALALFRAKNKLRVL